MKKLMNSLLVVALIGLLIPQCAFAQENAEGIVDKENYILSRGYNETILESLPEDAVDNIYNNLKNTFGGTALVSAQISDLDDSGRAEIARAGISKVKLEMPVILNNYIDEETGKVLECELIIQYDWLSTPTTNGLDAITVKWDSTYFTAAEDEFSGYSYVTNTETGQDEYYNFDMKIASVNSGGAGWHVNVFNSNTERSKQENPKGFIFFNLLPAYSYTAADDISSRITVLYNQNKATDSSDIEFIKAGTEVQVSGVEVDTLRTIVKFVSSVNSGAD